MARLRRANQRGRVETQLSLTPRLQVRTNAAAVRRNYLCHRMPRPHASLIQFSQFSTRHTSHLGYTAILTPKPWKRTPQESPRKAERWSFRSSPEAPQPQLGEHYRSPIPIGINSLVNIGNFGAVRHSRLKASSNRPRAPNVNAANNHHQHCRSLWCASDTYL